MTQLRAITNLATNSTKNKCTNAPKIVPKPRGELALFHTINGTLVSHLIIVFKNSRYSIAGNIGEGTLRQSEMLKVSVLCSIDGVLEILGICQYLPFSPYNHKNNLLINSETLHTKSQQRRSKLLIHLR